jgi:clan AA aspartic protease, TIGR02281 family
MSYTKAIVIAILVTILIFLAINGNQGGKILGLEPESLASAAFMLAMLVLVGSRLIIWDYKGRFGKLIRDLLIWCGLLATVTIGYIFWEDMGYVSSKIAGNLWPGYAAQNKAGETVITRNKDNDFNVLAKVNGQETLFIFDTGADSIVLQYETATALLGRQIPLDQFTFPTLTANGRTSSALIRLDTISVGNIIFNNVQAHVSLPGKLHQNLLGMSFFNRLSSFEVRGSNLILRP